MLKEVNWIEDLYDSHCLKNSFQPDKLRNVVEKILDGLNAEFGPHKRVIGRFFEPTRGHIDFDLFTDRR